MKLGRAAELPLREKNSPMSHYCCSSNSMPLHAKGGLTRQCRMIVFLRLAEHDKNFEHAISKYYSLHNDPELDPAPDDDEELCVRLTELINEDRMGMSTNERFVPGKR